MKPIYLALVAVVVVLAFGQGIAQAQSIQGAWMLSAAESTGDNPTTWEAPQGQIILADTTYCLFSVYPTRQPLPPPEAAAVQMRQRGPRQGPIGRPSLRRVGRTTSRE